MDGATATRVLNHALAVGPRCGSVVVIAIDGRSGAGKTTLAVQVRAAAAAQNLTTAMINTDEVCPGWSGLPEVPRRIQALIEELASRGRGTYPTWDWHQAAPGPDREVAGAEILLIEGTAASDARWRPHTSTSVWVDAPVDLRKQRAIDRDGDDFAPYWDLWAEAENRYFAERVAPPPDFIVDGT